MRIARIALGLSLFASPLAAQAPDSAAIKLKQRVDAILGIPQKADQARRSGVDDSALRTVLDIFVKEKVPASEAGTILTAESEGVREHGPTDNFGAFVQAQLASGRRGQELAAAIRAEHQARGRGRPASADEVQRGRPDDAGARGRRPDDSMNKGRKPEADSTQGKRPGNPTSKKPARPF